MGLGLGMDVGHTSKLIYGRRYFDTVAQSPIEYSIIGKKQDGRIANKALIGRKKSPEHCRNISLAMRRAIAAGRFVPPSTLGLKFSQDTRELMREVQRLRRLQEKLSGKTDFFTSACREAAILASKRRRQINTCGHPERYCHSHGMCDMCRLRNRRAKT